MPEGLTNVTQSTRYGPQPHGPGSSKRLLLEGFQGEDAPPPWDENRIAVLTPQVCGDALPQGLFSHARQDLSAASPVTWVFIPRAQ